MTTEKVTIYVCDYCGQKYLEREKCKECEDRCKATKFKIGDRVRVKTVDEMLFAGYSIVDDDVIFGGEYPMFVKDMVEYCGKEFTIAYVGLWRPKSYFCFLQVGESVCKYHFAEPCLELVTEK